MSEGISDFGSWHYGPNLGVAHLFLILRGEEEKRSKFSMMVHGTVDWIWPSVGSNFCVAKLGNNGGSVVNTLCESSRVGFATIPCVYSRGRCP